MMDLSAILQKKDVPECPICGGDMTINDYVTIVIVEGLVCLAHSDCADIEFFDA